jgi:hypothetical protein
VLLVCTVYNVLYSEIALSRKPLGIKYMYIYIYILLRMPDTMTSQNIDLCSWDILYTYYFSALGLFFYLEDDGSKFLRKVDKFTADCRCHISEYLNRYAFLLNSSWSYNSVF